MNEVSHAHLSNMNNSTAWHSIVNEVLQVNKVLHAHVRLSNMLTQIWKLKNEVFQIIQDIQGCERAVEEVQADKVSASNPPPPSLTRARALSFSLFLFLFLSLSLSLSLSENGLTNNLTPGAHHENRVP